MIHLTRREKFEAAFKMNMDRWSEEKNKHDFVKYYYKNWQRNNYMLHSILSGVPNIQFVYRALLNQLQPFLTQATLHSVGFHQSDCIYSEFLG